MRIRHPPGRSGRVWLRVRIDTATRAAELLEQKERVLLREEHRLRVLLHRTESGWNDACREAQIWIARATVLAGRRAISLAADPGGAASELQWRNSMGAYYPSEATCRLPERAALGDRTGTSAMTDAVRAHRHALERAVEHAAAQRAADEVDRELTATRRRRRMLEQRWLPALHTTLHNLEMSLEEHERDDAVHARGARQRKGTLP